jgi:hypothetical protein
VNGILLHGAAAFSAGLGGARVAAENAGFFATWFADMSKLADAGQYLEMLIDVRVLVLTAAFLILGFVKRSKGILLFLFAAYGIAATMHFATGSALKPAGGMIDNLNSIVVFLTGIGVVAAIVIYFTFIKGD